MQKDENEQRYHNLLRELKCMVCKGQSIDESNTIFANNIKKIVDEKMSLGLKDDEIIHFLEARYGEEIRLDPPIHKNTYIIWFSPLLLLIIGIIMIKTLLKKKHEN